MSKTRFNKANVLAHIDNSMHLLVAHHGERLQEGYGGIHIMRPSEQRDALMRAWAEHESLRSLYWDIVNGNLKEEFNAH